MSAGQLADTRAAVVQAAGITTAPTVVRPAGHWCLRHALPTLSVGCLTSPAHIYKWRPRPYNALESSNQCAMAKPHGGHNLLSGTALLTSFVKHCRFSRRDRDSSSRSLVGLTPPSVDSRVCSFSQI
jgi:hypothetical protein